MFAGRKQKMVKCADGIRRPRLIHRSKKELKSDLLARIKIDAVTKCWIWMAGRKENKKGRDYGIVWANGKRYPAHVLSFKLHGGRLRKDQIVCHDCDNPPCCNPEHLFAGTDKDNCQDKIKKGRAKYEKGSDRYNAKLTEADVVKIKQLLKTVPAAHVATEFKVSKTAIHNIKNGLRWKHVK